MISTSARRALGAGLIAVLAAVAQAQVADAGSSPGSAQSLAVDNGWPRTFEKDGNTLVMHQPQVDSWTNYDKIAFRCAIELTADGAKDPVMGVCGVTADTFVDHEMQTVVMTNLKVAVRFATIPPDQSGVYEVLAKDAIGNRSYMCIALNRVLAYMHGSVKPRTAAVNLDPPPIFYSETPANLVMFMGPPQFKPVDGTGLMFAINTNWPVFMDTASSQYYLLDAGSWMTAPDPVNGPWTVAGPLPAALSQLPSGKEWDNVRKYVPGQPFKTVPRIFATTQPAELIVTNGEPSYVPIPGTRLMYVDNPPMPVFLDLADGHHYFLVAGRWFRGNTIMGPWTAASATLPTEFAKIPSDSPMAYVLSAIPGTQEASDAVLLAGVPHKAVVNVSTTTVNVTYAGAPKFVPIDGTQLQYAINTGYQVIQASGQFYCCYQGVWFMSPAASGPWVVCTAVPQVIYTIPPASPVYNVTYVQVYNASPTTVTVGYTSGYSGEYVAATGALMFGAGMLVGAALAENNCCWYSYSPCMYSYGCAAAYHYGYGSYYRGAACYGPYGGAGYHAGYNPATGVWSRGGYAYGPGGAASYHQAYNPWTNTYGAHAGATNGYQSWGASTVSRGDQWASAAHTTGPAGVSQGWAENSSGQWAHGYSTGPGGTTVAQTSSGNTYASHDGNVYKQSSSGQWQKYGSDGWSDVSRPSTSSAQATSAQSARSWQDQYHSTWAGDSNRTPTSSQDRTWGGGDSNRSWGGSSSWADRDSWARDQGNSNESRWGGGSRSWGGGWGGGSRSWGGGGGFRGRR